MAGSVWFDCDCHDSGSVAVVANFATIRLVAIAKAGSLLSVYWVGNDYRYAEVGGSLRGFDLLILKKLY